MLVLDSREVFGVDAHTRMSESSDHSVSRVGEGNLSTQDHSDMCGPRPTVPPNMIIANIRGDVNYSYVKGTQGASI